MTTLISRSRSTRLVAAFCAFTLLGVTSGPEAARAAAAAIDQSSAPATLGKLLFADKRLSADGKVSCATCHVPAKALSDGLPVAVGVHGQRGHRNTPSLWNVASLPSQFWDGRRTTLEKQALDPLLNPREHGMQREDAIVSIIRSDAQYRAAFASAFGLSPNEINPKHIAIALATFERTLISNDSPFDRFLYKAESAAMSEAAIRGLDLFRGRAECATCHSVGEREASLTDHQFHSLGVSFETIAPRLADITQRVSAVDGRDLDQLIAADANVAALGRFAVTKDPRDIGKFRTPSLRNVALTAPYMHDGSVPTLEAAIDSEVYYRGLERGRPLILTPREKADLVAFLNALTGSGASSTHRGDEDSTASTKKTAASGK